MHNIPQVDPEFKALIPPLSQEEYDQLEQNILHARKCYDPIVIWNGKLLEGFHRFKICIKHGIEFQIVEMDFESREEAKLWMLNNQLARRNLNEAQRIEVVLKKEEVLRLRAKKKQSKGGGDKKSAGSLLPKMEKPQIPRVHVQETMAAEAKVSKGTLHNYTEVKEHANPALLAAVQSGEVKIGTAHRMLSKGITKQLNQLEKNYEHMIRCAMPEGLLPNHPDLHEKLTGLHNVMLELITKLEERRNNN